MLLRHMNDYERALSHWDEFDRTGDVAQLALAVDLLRTAHATASPADRYLYGGNLGLALSRLYDQTYDLGILRESIDVLRGGLREGATDDGYASNLALALQKYAAEMDDLAALDESIGLMREVSGSASVDQDLRARVLSALSTALQDRYELASDPKALAESVTVGRASLVITPEGHPRRGPHLAHLGLALRMTYESTGDLAALAEAVEVSREAVHAVDDEVPSKDIEMSSLSLALRMVYEAHGQLAVLDESIVWLRRAVARLAPDHGRQAPHHSNLALALWTRYERTGDLAVLREAVDAARTAVDRTDTDSSDHRLYSNNLGLTLWSLHERDPESNALNEAIEHFRHILAGTGESRIFFHQSASNLAVALHARFLRRGTAADLQDAIAAAELADRAAAESHVDRQRYLSLLGTLHQDGYARDPDPARLEAAIASFRSAVAASPPDHPDSALFRLNLGTALVERWRAGDQADGGLLAEARGLLGEAAHSPSGAPRVRVEAARSAGDAAAEVQDWPAALTCYAIGVEQLPKVAPGHLDLADRGRELGRFLGLASDAAAAAFHCGDPGRALQLLENGRGLLLQTFLDDIPLLDELRTREPRLADDFVWARHRLDRTRTASASMPGLGGIEAEDLHAVGNAWDATIERIRAIPGFDTFLRPTPVDDLLTAIESDGAATDTPVIVVNSSRLRCDAVVIRRGAAVHVPLPLLIHEETGAHARDLRRVIDAVADSSDAGRAAAERRFGETFDTVSHRLFQTVAGPVLAATGPVSRVHWIPTGALTALPLHAAGEHAPGDLLERVISSYAATLRGLRAPAAEAVASQERILVVSEGPGLEGTEREAGALQQLFGTDRVTRPVPATVDNVVDALPQCSTAHIALHGYSDPDDPLSGALELADGDLDVAAISRLRLTAVRLAYLSACDTAAPDDGRSDEPVHLAAAFRSAGCRHVVATLWPAEDDSAADIALDFYGQGVPEDPAYAINQAQRRRRTAAPGAPLTWGPYEHWGVLA